MRNVYKNIAVVNLFERSPKNKTWFSTKQYTQPVEYISVVRWYWYNVTQFLFVCSCPVDVKSSTYTHPERVERFEQFVCLFIVLSNDYGLSAAVHKTTLSAMMMGVNLVVHRMERCVISVWHNNIQKKMVWMLSTLNYRYVV